MTQLGDVHVKRPTSGATGDPSTLKTVVAIVAILLIGIGFYWFFSNDTAVVEPSPAEMTDIQLEPTLPAPEPPPPSLVELPELTASDSFVRDVVTALSAHPDLARWLVSDRLVHRFVVVVDNIAEGKTPSQHVLFMKPDTGFRVTSTVPRASIDLRSYRRYDLHAQIIDSLDTQGTAEIYLMLEPLMSEAYVELGYPDTRFRNTLERAVAHLLDTPVLDEPPIVERRITFFEYADPTLEALTPVQKQFIGMGPDNMRTVQSKLLVVSRAIGISSGR